MRFTVDNKQSNANIAAQEYRLNSYNTQLNLYNQDLMPMDAKPEEPKSKRDGILDKIQNFVTSGYGKKEDLRELDKALREQYYSELMALRHRWEKVYLEALEAGQSPIGRECKKVQEQALNRVLEYDKTLAGNLTQIDKEVEAAEASVSELNWSQLRTNINTLKKSLTAFDEGWRNRKQAMSG
jgi:peptidoglycan hydrolase CwlO-like protein